MDQHWAEGLGYISFFWLTNHCKIDIIARKFGLGNVNINMVLMVVLDSNRYERNARIVHVASLQKMTQIYRID